MSNHYLLVYCRTCNRREMPYIGDVDVEHFDIDMVDIEIYCNECVKAGKATP
ncbi:hypothetical protein [Rhodococcus sp. ACS1]|uniref:hypothetical protein n=1 Tax=Rhodococcus sp. ACS1 TaxID=2028570 RepID=UPI0015C6D8E1|nr:hypothetical protein [Rhodococcus sp. ACS1]